MAAIKIDNPFEKGTKQYGMYKLLATGKEVTADQLREAAKEPLSNRTMGVFIRDLEAKKFRFTRTKKAELGIVYVMHHGDDAKGVTKISVTPGSYKERIADKPAAKTTKKAAASKPAAVAKATAKPAKKVASKAATPAKKVLKKQSRGDDEEVTPTKKAVAKKAAPAKVKLAIKSKAA